MKQWDADIQLGDEAVARLIARQFPALAPVRLAPLGTGWDNVAFLVNEALVFRFPRRQVAAHLLAREARVLPLLAPHLPLPVPAPTQLGTPTPDYPFAFTGYPLLVGSTACRLACSDAERAALAPALGRALAALHGIPLDTATLRWAPRDEIARADLLGRAPTVAARLRANAAGLGADDVQALTTSIAALATTPPAPTAALRWVHGDLYARHLVLDERKDLAGIIDWGDVHVGDPALDLSIALSFLPPAARRPFRAAYGEIDPATWRRARFRAIHYGAILAEYGRESGDRAIAAVGDDALRLAAGDDYRDGRPPPTRRE